MVITQDDDWSSIASKASQIIKTGFVSLILALDQYDTIPDPHELLEQILVSHRICEEDG